MNTLTMPARLDSLEPLISSVLEKAIGAGASEALLNDIRLVLEEILTNIVFYAYPSGDGQIRLEYDWMGDGEIFITVTDWGDPFDPLSMKPPDLEKNFEEREIGGLGVFLVKRLAHGLSYQRGDGTNHLTIRFHVA